MQRGFRLAAIAGLIAMFGGLIAAVPASADNDHGRDHGRQNLYVRRDRDDWRQNWDQNDWRWNRDRDYNWHRDHDRDYRYHRDHRERDDR